MDGVTLRVLRLLVEIGVWAAVVLVSSTVSFLLWRERTILRVARTLPPEERTAFRRDARSVPFLRRPSAPKDPSALTTPVTIEPQDGCPGWTVMAPGPPAQPPSRSNAIHGRQDALVQLDRGMWLIVHRDGRVGDSLAGQEVLPAAERVLQARRSVVAPGRLLGPVDRVELPLGAGWRTTLLWETTGRAVTDTFLDHDGWAYVVGVVSRSEHARAVELLDRVLATWRWLPLPVIASEPPPW